MANVNFNPLVSSFSRVFLIEGRAKVSVSPSYQAFMKAGSPSQSFGDVTKIEVPDPDRFGQFLEVGVYRGTIERATMDLMGKYASDLRDELLRLARKGCPVDIHINFGACQTPSDYDNGWDKTLVLKNAFLTEWSTDNDLGAMNSGEQNEVNATSPLSAESLYEILPLTLLSKGSTVITNELLDVIIGDQVSCGDCDDPSDGCQRIYAISSAAGGSAGTAADVVTSINGGATWFADDIDTLGAAENPSAIARLNNDIVVFSADSNSLHYAPKSDVDNVLIDTSWTEVTTGFVAGGQPRDAHSLQNSVFVCGNGGYIYKCVDPASGVTVLDAGSAVQDDLLSISMLTDSFGVAVGNSGAIVRTTDGESWGALDRFVGAGVHLNVVLVKNSREWFAGTNTGVLYYTENGGTTWTVKAFPGSGSGEIHDITIVEDSVMTLAHETAAGAGRMLRSRNSGNSWYVLPEGSALIPANDKINALAACEDNVNFVVGVGLADDASDGYIVVGS